MYKVGIVGFSSGDFNRAKAQEEIEKAFGLLDILNKEEQVEIVSGLTNIGVPAMAYKESRKYDWKTRGIACAKAEDYECFPCDEVQIVGEEWGDESETFLNYCDILLKFGGGKQSEAEFEAFTGDKFEFDI